jgi:hypothetical protein
MLCGLVCQYKILLTMMMIMIIIIITIKMSNVKQSFEHTSVECLLKLGPKINKGNKLIDIYNVTFHVANFKICSFFHNSAKHVHRKNNSRFPKALI